MVSRPSDLVRGAIAGAATAAGDWFYIEHLGGLYRISRAELMVALGAGGFAITGADNAHLFRLAGVTNGLRALSSGSGFVIEAVDPTWNISYKPLYLAGTEVFVTAVGGIGARFGVNGLAIGNSGAPAAAFHARGTGLNALIVDTQNATSRKFQVAWRRLGVDAWSMGPDIAGSGGSDFYFHNYLEAQTRLIIAANGHLTPGTDNLQDVGGASARWAVIRAGTGTIATSDQRDKQDIRALTEAEKRVAIALARLVRMYRWKDAVAAKGEAARLHAGWIAQEVVAAFEAEELDPFAYGCVGFDEITRQEAYTTTESRPKMQEVTVEEQVVRIVAGQPRLVTETRTEEQPLGAMHQVVGEDGLPILNADGQPMRHFVPEMETVEVEHQRTVPVLDGEGQPYKRMNLRYAEVMAFVIAALAPPEE